MQYADKKIIYLTAGAGGMFCGSCLHDNALSHALSKQGWDIQLVPTYTPIRTDETDYSVDQVLFGGINVYLQQKLPLLRYVPSVLDRFLDSPWLIRKVTSRSMDTDAKTLGKLAHSMLLGSKGNQRKEVAKVCKWVRLAQPDLIIFSNFLIGGCIEDLKSTTGLTDVPILVTLQGDDVFLDSLREPYKSKCIDRVKLIASSVDGFIVQSDFYRGYMAEYFSIEPERIHVTPLGLDVSDFAGFGGGGGSAAIGKSGKVIGYMSRLAPEKGLHHLVDGFIELKSRSEAEYFKLKIAGWLGAEHQAYVHQQWGRLDDAGLSQEYQYLGAIERQQKLDFFREIDVLSVPTDFLEPKGLYALESLAAGVPVVLPSHGAFPELIEQSGGGIFCQPRNPGSLADSLMQLLTDDQQRISLGLAGQNYVRQHRNSEAMAAATSLLIERFLEPN